MGYYITRQRDYKDNALYVEIAIGGKMHASPDVLTPRYEGELKNLVDPRDAISAAEKIYEQWENDYGDERKKLRIISKDDSIVFDFSSKGIQSAKVWADKIYSGMKKCGHCNRPLGNRPTYEVDDIANMVFCAETCLARKYRDMFGIEAPNLSPKKKKDSSQIGLFSRP